MAMETASIQEQTKRKHKGMEAISNKQLGKHQEPDRNRNRNYENQIVGNGSNKHSTTHLEHDDEAGSSEHSSEVSGSFKDLRRYLELDAETGSSNRSDTHSEVINEDAGIESNHFEPEQNDKHDVPGNNSSKLEGQNGDASVTLTSEVSSVTDEPTLLQSPPVQVMDRVQEHGCYKIPSAVFARTESNTPVDNWSVPSNESLFSIRIENDSFVRDHIVSSKSRELFKSGDFDELSTVPVSTVPVEDTNKMGGGSHKREETSLSDDVVRNNTGPSTEEPNMKRPRRPMISWNSATISHHSVDRVATEHPIAHHSVDRVATEHPIGFPVRNKKSACSSCNCSSCWLAFCFNWKCTTSPDGTCSSSKEKAQGHQQEEVPMTPSIPSKSARISCCSCFSSCR